MAGACQAEEEQQFTLLLGEDNKRRFQCSACSRILSRQQTIENHLKTVHGYNGPRLFKRKYKLYEEDAKRKIPRQTEHNRRKRHTHQDGMLVNLSERDQRMVYSGILGTEIPDGLRPTLSNSMERIRCAELICCNDQDNVDFAGCSDQDNVDFAGCSDQDNYDEVTSDSDGDSDMSSSSDSGLSVTSSTEESDMDVSDEEISSETNQNDLELQEISMAIMSFVSRHSLTNEAARDMIELINIVHTEKQMLQSLSFNMVQEACGHCEIRVYDICEVCLRLFPENKEIHRCLTEGCDGLRYKGSLREQSKRRNKNSFATVNIYDQLKSLLERDGVWKIIQQRIATRGKPTMTDIIDGKYYLALCEEGQFLHNSNNISLIFNTDGAPLYSSSSVSLWPVFLAINELPSPDRFSKQNMLMWGIWQGKGKPPFGVYFEPFAAHMSTLYKEGLKIKPSKQQNSVNVRVAVLLGSTDLQGKAYLLDMTHHNGENGCLTCEEPGLVVSQGKGHTRCYPFKSATKAAAKRTCQSFLKNALEANTKNVEVKGLFGVTSLALMEWFDIVLGMVPDYMHGCLLGITKNLLHKWLSPKHHKKAYFIGGQISKINKRLVEMRPPDTLARLPRDIEKHFKNLKASELQAWLLYYSLPCLVGFLPDRYLLHFANFAEGIFLLLGDSISPSSLSRARDLLNVFYRDFKELYGEGSCGLNVHNAGAHLADYVEGWGPLWAWSTFGFEDMNGTLMDFTHGTGNVCRQLIWMLHAASRLRFEVNLMRESSYKEFIKRMISTKREIKNLKAAKNCSIAGGVQKFQGVAHHVSRAVTTLIGEESIYLAARIVVKGHVFFSKRYTRMVKRNPCAVQFHDNTLGEIEFFAWSTLSGEVVAVYRQLEINMERPFFFNEAGHHVLRVKNERSQLKVRKVEEILEKVLLLEGNPNNPCVIRFPNFNGVCG